MTRRPASSDPQRCGVHILIVDDHPSVRKAVAEECRRLGCRVSTAANGAEALDVLDSFEPDMIVLDLHMPVMDGREFAMHYRQRPRHQAALVLLTAERDIERIGREIDVDAWIPKTLPDRLAETIAALLGNSPQT